MSRGSNNEQVVQIDKKLLSGVLWQPVTPKVSLFILL